MSRSERDPGHALEARLVLGIALLRRGEAAKALAALGELPPPAGHPQQNAWFHNRVSAQAALGDLAAVQQSMRRWQSFGLPPAELAARYAVSLSMAGLADPRRDIVSLLRDALVGQDEIGDPLIVSWVHQRLISQLLAEGRGAEALAAFDAGSARATLAGITRAEILRSIARASLAAAPAGASAATGRVRFVLEAGAPAGELRVSADASEPPDRDFERHAIAPGAGLEVVRSIAAWPLRWVYASRVGEPLASGSLWPEPGKTLEVGLGSGRPSLRSESADYERSASAARATAGGASSP